MLELQRMNSICKALCVVQNDFLLDRAQPWTVWCCIFCTKIYTARAYLADHTNTSKSFLLPWKISSIVRPLRSSERDKWSPRWIEVESAQQRKGENALIRDKALFLSFSPSLIIYLSLSLSLSLSPDWSLFRMGDNWCNFLWSPWKVLINCSSKGWWNGLQSFSNWNKKSKIFHLSIKKEYKHLEQCQLPSNWLPESFRGKTVINVPSVQKFELSV